MNPPARAFKLQDAARRIVFAEQDRFLARDIQRLSGTNLSRCYHCRSCGNGCPFIRGMDYPPNGIIRLVQFGLRQAGPGVAYHLDLRGVPHLLRPVSHGD